MKKHLLIFLFLLVDLTAQGQGTFAPLGAEWWLGGQGLSYTFWPGGFLGPNQKWTDHVVSTNDTIIDNINCRKLLVNRYKRIQDNPDSIFINNAISYFVYDNVDTVFIYNDYFQKFTPLYIFNAQEQDTICLPLLAESFGFNHFCFVVDSIRIELHDTSHLKSFYTRTIGADTQEVSFNWGRAGLSFAQDETKWVNKGKYVEKIGGSYRGITSLLSYSSYHNQDAGMSVSLPSGNLRCYSDSSTKITLTSGNCDEVELTGINGVYKSDLELKFYPNPTTDKLSFSTNTIFNEATLITIFDIRGKLVWSTSLAKNSKVWTLSLPSLNSGIYLLKAQNSVGTQQQKLLVE